MSVGREWGRAVPLGNGGESQAGEGKVQVRPQKHVTRNARVPDEDTPTKTIVTTQLNREQRRDRQLRGQTRVYILQYFGGCAFSKKKCHGMSI